MRTQHRNRNGFTLIELLIVIVIIGVLAAIAMATWNSRKNEAIVASMKSDLRNLAVSEEAYFTEFHAYASDVDDLEFRSSPDVVFTLQADQDGWTANASHPSVAIECGQVPGCGIEGRGLLSGQFRLRLTGPDHDEGPDQHSNTDDGENTRAYRLAARFLSAPALGFEPFPGAALLLGLASHRRSQPGVVGKQARTIALATVPVQ